MPTSAIAVAHAAPGGRAEGRIVDGLGRVGAVVDDLVAGRRQHRDEVLLELVSGVIGAERDACHCGRVYEAPRHRPGSVDETSAPDYLLHPAVASDGADRTACLSSGSMTIDPRTPVLVGGGQVLHRADGVADALEPAALMARAIEAAADDAGLAAPPDADSIRVVSSLSWRYQNPAFVVAGRLGLEPRELAVTTMGGNSPQALVNTTARQILGGELDVAILTGGEAWRTRMRARREGAELDWPRAPDEQPPTTIGSEFTMNHQAELDRGIVQPVQVYPMFDTAIRAASGQESGRSLELISEMWSRFSDVAAANPNAWSRRAHVGGRHPHTHHPPTAWSGSPTRSA